MMRALFQPAFYRYVRHLPPRMVIGKATHAVISRFRVPRAARSLPPPNHSWPNVFRDGRLYAFAEVFRVHGDRFAATCERLHHGEFVSNGVSYSFGSPDAVHWKDSVLPGTQFSRWHHDLAFFAFAMPLVTTDPDRGIESIASMVKALDHQLEEDPSELRKFHWSPIATATRLLSLTSALALMGPAVSNHEVAVAIIGTHLWRAGEMLKLTVERYLGFNHAATTQAGLVVALLLQNEEQAAHQEILELLQTLERSTLSDGLWAERSPAYHIHMLVLVAALTAMLPGDSAEQNRLLDLGTRMRSAAATVLHPDGEIAVFNDAAIADAPAPSAIGCLPDDSASRMVLPDGGYARISRAGTVVIMDAGPMGPDAVIGHGHADFLSIEVSVGGNRIIVDPGVASVTSGADRLWTRSAASHNGPTLDGCEPAEFFGTWRVGRRGRARFTDFSTEASETPFVNGECDGYSQWGITVKRRVALDASGKLAIEDRWDGRPTDGAVVSFLVPRQWAVKREGSDALTLRHFDGTIVTLTVNDGTVSRVDRCRTFPEGPMQQEDATRLVLKPRGKSLTTKLGVCAAPDPGPFASREPGCS